MNTSFSVQRSALSVSRPPVRIGTRGSVLARWQAGWVTAALCRAFPDGDFAEVIVRTTGDIQRRQSLARIGGLGVFTRELDTALLEGRIDLAVHSAKDYPTNVPEGLFVAAYPLRERANDALVGRRGEHLGDLPSGALIGTGSLRRLAQLRRLRPDLRFGDIRGNVETRLRKLDAGQYDGVVLAEAALRRLGLAARPREVLPVSRLVPAAGQGALMVVCRRDDRRTRRLAARISNDQVEKSISAERAVLRGLGGGCRLPFGVHARIRGERIRLRAVVVSPDGSRKVTAFIEADARDGLRAARRAVNILLRKGAREIVEQIGKKEF